MRIGGTAEMAWMQICDPSDKEKGQYSIEISDGVTTHTRTFDLSGQGRKCFYTSVCIHFIYLCLYLPISFVVYDFCIFAAYTDAYEEYLRLK